MSREDTTRQRAESILRTCAECESRIKASIMRVKDECNEECYGRYRDLAARLIARMFNNVIAPIYECYPDLAPDWYNGDTGGRSPFISEELRKELTALTDDVFAQMEDLPNGGPDIPDGSGIRPLDDRVEAVLASIVALKAFLDQPPEPKG